MRLGHTASRAGQYGLVIDYDGEYTIEWQDGSVQKLGSFYWEQDIPEEPEIAALRRESRADTLTYTSGGWDIVSLKDMEDDEFESGIPRKPDLDRGESDPGLIWDPITHTYVRRQDRDKPFRSYADPELAPGDTSRGEATYWAQNPELEGVFSRTACIDCGIEHGLGVKCPLAQVHPQTEPFLERSPKPNQLKLDPSFPSDGGGIVSSQTKDLRSMLYSSHNSYTEPETPNLRDCPEAGCGGKMMDVRQESLCHDCGHREPIIYHQAKELPTTDEMGPVDPNAPGPSNWDLAGMALAPFAGAAATVGGGELLGAEGAGTAAALAGRALNLGGKADVAQRLLGDVLGGGGNSGGGGAAQAAPSPLADSSTDDMSKMGHDDDVGIAIDNDGQDSFPDAGNKGFTDDEGDSPEILKDTNELGGTANHDDLNKALDTFEIFIPHVLEHHKNGTGHDDPIIQLLDQMFKLVPSSEDEEGDTEKKESAVKLSTPPTCPTCQQDLTGAVSCKSPNPQQVAVCPIFSGLNATMHGGPQNAMTTNPMNAMQPHASVEDMHEWEKTAARRPKMCPFHTTLIDYALTIGDPAGALHAMGTHMFGDKSCQGGWEGVNKNGNPSKCRYKPEMIQQSYWDSKEAEAEQRRQQRELQQQQLQQMQVPQVQPEMVQPEVVDPNAPQVLIPDVDAFLEEDAPVTQDIPAVDAITTPTDYEPAEQGMGYVEQPSNVYPINTPQPMPVAAHYTAKSVVDYIERMLKQADDPSAPMPDDSVDMGMGDPNVGAEPVGNSIPTDTNGQPLEEGQTYEMQNPANNSFIPDRITIQQVDPHFIQFKVENDVEEGQPFAFQDEMPTSQIKMEGITFKPSGGDDLHPNARGQVFDPESNNDDHTHAEDGRGVDDLDTGGNSKGASTREWLNKEAGRDFSPREQRDFVNEFDMGGARNLDKLDLSGTHYPESDDEYADFLWS